MSNDDRLDVLESQEAEIARLRAEVERLKTYGCSERCAHVCHRYPLGTAYAIEELKRERDEALRDYTELKKSHDLLHCQVSAAVAERNLAQTKEQEALAALNDAKKALKIMNQNLDDLSRAKQEALAQVARLHQKIQSQLNHPDLLGSHESDPHFMCAVCEWYGAIPTEARALLDRLAMLEDGAMTNQRLVWLEDRLQALQRIVDSLSPLQERLRHHPIRGESDSLVETAIKVVDQLERCELGAKVLQECYDKALDWLQRAEAVVEAAKQWHYRYCDNLSGKEQARSWRTLDEALAAWEEWKA